MDDMDIHTHTKYLRTTSATDSPKRVKKYRSSASIENLDNGQVMPVGGGGDGGFRTLHVLENVSILFYNTLIHFEKHKPAHKHNTTPQTVELNLNVVLNTDLYFLFFMVSTRTYARVWFW